MAKDIDELSLEEVLEQLKLKKNEGRKYNLDILIIKLSELIEQLSNKNLDKIVNETILYHKHIKLGFPNIFSKICYSNYSLSLLIFNVILDKELKEKIIVQSFGQFFKRDSQKAIELLNSISSKELKDKTISENFGQIFEIDSQKAIELLNTISLKELQDKTISEKFEQIFKIDSQKTIELLNTISLKELQDKAISKNFRHIFKIDFQKAIELLNGISSKQLKKEAFNDFEKIISTLDNRYIKIKSINYYINFALKNGSTPNIDLVKEIVNQDLKNRMIETFFNDFMQKNRALSIRLLSKISDNRLQEKIVVNYLLKYNLIDMELLTFCSRNTIKEKFISPKIDELNNIQKNINNQNKSNAIFKAHREVQKGDNSILELEELTVNRLSFLIIHEEEESNFNRLLNEFSKRVQKEGKNYSELIFKTIRESKIQNEALLELEKYIDKKGVKNRLRKLKEDRASQQSVNEILEIVLNSRKKRDREKEKYFTQLFKEKHDIQTIYAIIPQIATKDFRLAKRLLNRVKDETQREKTQEEIFLNLQENLEQVMYAYKRIKDFHTKERLSKIALAHHLPNFTNSFFHKSLSALDSQNIINTLDELSTIAPREVLKYYGEIEDNIADRVEEVIKKIKELKSEREEAENLEDEELFDNVEIEAQKLKDEILEDRELLEAFITRVRITEFKFKRGSLLDFV